jgi:hypothetical protein
MTLYLRLWRESINIKNEKPFRVLDLANCLFFTRFPVILLRSVNALNRFAGATIRDSRLTH